MMHTVASPSSPSGSWLRRLVRILLAFVVGLAFAGFLYENVSEARDRRFNPSTGHLINVGGLKMHMDCTGQGSPTVILESGLGDSYVSWRKVQPQMEKFTRVCSYDRAGLGFSGTSSRPRTSQVIAEELHALLRAADVAPPYVLVGHSMGGFDVRLFASLYRGEVAGMMLVDASHPEQQERLPPALNDLDATWLREQEFFESTMPFGVPRLLGFCGSGAARGAADGNFCSA